MAKISPNSLSYSLKGKIWIATTVLAFFLTTIGLVSNLVVSYLVTDSLYVGVFQFLFLAVIVVIFGWWLSNEIGNPIERVLLVAKSLERGVSTSLPKNSGSSETDELLQSLHRVSQQVQKLVNSMDEAARGNLNVALTTDSTSDRVTVSFHKILAKVSESIGAKNELEKIKAEIGQVSGQLKAVRENNLDTTVRSETPELKEISETINYLIEQLGEVSSKSRGLAAQTHEVAQDMQGTIENLQEQSERRIQEMNQASLALKQVPQVAKKIHEELSQSASAATLSAEKAQSGNQKAQANMTAVNQLRKKVQESIKRIQKLNEHSSEIGKVAKTAEDLAHRTSMVALNASVQAIELGEEGRGIVVVSEEVERLAERANTMNKNISALNKSVQSEIGKVESSLEAAIGEVAELSRFAIETETALSELERYTAQFLKLQNKILSYSSEQNDEAEKAFQVFISSISENENAVALFKKSSSGLENIFGYMARLQNYASGFNTGQSFANGDARPLDTPAAFSDFEAPIPIPDTENYNEFVAGLGALGTDDTELNSENGL